MKKLMTSLLAVLLCGIGFLWADGVTVSGKATLSAADKDVFFDSYTVSLAPSEGPALDTWTDAMKYEGNDHYWTFEFRNVPDGSYTLNFTGVAGRKYIATQSITVNGANIENIELSLVASEMGDMTVEVGFEVDNTSYGYTYKDFKRIKGAQVSYKQTDETGDATTVTTDENGKATFEANYTKTYTITVKATGCKDSTLENVAVKSSQRIVLTVIPVTLSGTLTWNNETISSFPDKMGLAIVIDGTKYTPELNSNGYTVTCKAGEATAYVTTSDYSNGTYNSDLGTYVSNVYGVTTPANGIFTITPNNDNTATQNITVGKTSTKVTVPVNAEDQISYNDLKLTTADGKTIDAHYSSSSTQIIFNGVPAGTYTLVLNKIGFKIKDDMATVTVNESLDEVTTPTLVIEAAPTMLTISGVAQYRDKTNTENDSRGELVNLGGATVNLYAAKADYATQSYILDEDALGTATVAEDGTFSFTAGIKQSGIHIAMLTHETIRPSYSDPIHIYSAMNQTADFTGNINMIWISGEVTNHADLSNVELTWTGDNVTPTSAKSEYDQTTGKYYAYVSGTGPMPGTYTLNLKATSSKGLLMVASEEVTIAADKKAVTKDLTATQDPNSGLMTVTYKYKAAKNDIAVAGLGVSVYLNDGSEEGEYLTGLTTDDNGAVKYVVEKDKTYKLTTLKLANLGYAATKVSVNGFATINDTLRPNDTTIYLEALPIQAWIKLTGTVTLPEGVAKLSDLGEDLRIAVQTQRDLDVKFDPIKSDNTYAIDSIPVIKKNESGTMPLFLAQTGGKTNAYGVEVPYNYGLDITSYNTFTTQDYTTNTVDVTIKKIACNVSGTVSPAREGQVTLTKQGDEEPAYTTNVISGKYTFQGVTAGTYTLKTNCTGYEPATAEVTVEATLADVTVPAITLNDAPLDVTAHGSLTATNPANETTYYFAGAKLAIWNSDKTQALVETTVTEDNNGWFSMTFRSVKGAKVFFTMEHPSIEPISKEYTVNGADLEISASDLGYKFIDNTPNEKVVMTDFDAKWNATFDSLKLSWKWPASADGKIQTITLNRKLSTESGNGVTLKTWEKTGENPHETYAFATAELPVGYTDTVKQSLSYTYMFTIIYADASHSRKDVSFVADMRDGKRYELAYTVNDDKMGTLTSYGQPEGKYLEGDQITLTAKAKEGYKFVEFLKNDEKLSEAEIATLKLYSDTMAIYGFKMPAYDLTVKAVFVSRSGEGPNDPETKEYTVTLVSNNEAWGTVSGAGTFEEGKEIEVKATVTDEAKYKFVAWKEGDKELSKDATYKFKVEKDITLTAVFEEKVANENLKAARWAIFAEDGAIVIKGINGDRYDIYDLNGHHCGAALCTGAEIRLNVAKSKLYIVRRLGADGSFDAKKIVVR